MIHDFLAALENGADVAYGIRRNRKENVLKRLAYSTFYKLLRLVSSIDIPLDAGDFSAMRRCVLEDMLELPERNRFVRGIRAWVGYRQVAVPYDRHARHQGQSKYSLLKLMGLAYDGIFSFSCLPIKLMQLGGFVVSALAFAIGFFHVAWYSLAPQRFPLGWMSLIVSIWFLGGVQLVVMGLLGEYVFRAFDESRARPTALVREQTPLTNDAVAAEANEQNPPLRAAA